MYFNILFPKSKAKKHKSFIFFIFDENISLILRQKTKPLAENKKI